MKKSALKFILLLFFISLADLCFSQTCIILKATPTTIIIGADSKGTTKNWVINSNEVSEQSKSVSVCKIHKKGKFYYSLAGQDFKIDSIITKISNYNLEFDLFSNTCIETVAFYLKNLLETIRQYNKTFLLKEFNVEDEITQLIFFGFEKNKPKVKAVGFSYSKDMDIPIEIYLDSATVINNYVAMGDHDVIDNDLKNKAIWNSKGDIDAIKYFINKQADSTPQIVSKPIVIMKLTNNKIYWMPHKNLCN
jgi:hypothetical protein